MMTSSSTVSSYNIDLKDHIRTVSGFPKAGIEFRDITSLLENPKAFNKSLSDLTSLSMSFGADKIVGIESRGFVFGAPLARDLELPFIMARKPGKLPGHVYRKDYELEYGTASLNIQCNTDIVPDDKVVIIDDLIATGGTAIACADIIHEHFGVPKENIQVLALIDLPTLKGSAIIQEHGYIVNTLIEFEGL
jgi:adenine phosphoribosyltransferase